MAKNLDKVEAIVGIILENDSDLKYANARGEASRKVAREILSMIKKELVKLSTTRAVLISDRVYSPDIKILFNVKEWVTFWEASTPEVKE